VDKEKLESVIESLLFVSGEPLAVSRLAQVSGTSEEEVSDALSGLAEAYAASCRGLMLVRRDGEVQLATKAENASYLESMVKGALQESLSKAALEVLSVIAYRGPIARAEIEAIRGVNCSMTLRNLLMRELIERQGNPNDSRGYLYVVSVRFLRELGLGGASELPDYEALRRDDRVEAVLKGSDGSAADRGSEAGERLFLYS
jgi:segregation and condensation protein B